MLYNNRIVILEIEFRFTAKPPKMSYLGHILPRIKGGMAQGLWSMRGVFFFSSQVGNVGVMLRFHLLLLTLDLMGT